MKKDERELPEPSEQSREYSDMRLLEDLESLREELEERGLSGFAPGENIPDDLQALMAELEVKSIEQIREKIMNLNAALDASDDDIQISDS